MNSVIASYGCNSLNNDVRNESSSGGIFSILAEAYLKNGGVVYGTAMSEDCKDAVFKRVDQLVDLQYLRGSKYLQSSLGDTFRQIQIDLQNGVQVMFSGCPCQVNGLKLFLRKEYDNLFCMDIICHGVPSPELWRRYSEHFEEKNHAALKRVNFRSKSQSWNDFGLMHYTDKKQLFSSKVNNPYLQMFLKNYVLRPACYECASKSYRTADLSIGDFWGVESVLPELNDCKGTSLVLVRSEKGANIFEMIKGQVKYAPCEYEQAVKRNSADYKSVVKPIQRDSFFVDMEKMSFKKLEGKYLGSPINRKVKRIAKRLIGRA